MSFALPDFSSHPGYFFVAATFLPLVSFLLILLAAGLWSALRPYRETQVGGALYNLFGGDRRGPLPAYLALAAIFGAFLLSATGAILYTQEQTSYEEPLQKHEQEIAKLQRQQAQTDDIEEQERLEKKIEELENKGQQYRWEERWQAAREERWQGRFTWARIQPRWISEQWSRALKTQKPSAAEPMPPPPGTTLQLGFRIDSLSAVMFVMVTFIASLIHLFSIGYMSEERAVMVEDHQVHTEEGHLHRRGRFGRFFMYLSLFCFSMLNLVLADNLFQVFLSWELVGICSYLLVGFYFERQSASNAANKAFITNRIGDAGFIIGLLILFTHVGTFNFEEIFQAVRAPVRDSHGHYTLSQRIVRGTPIEASSDTHPGRLLVEPNGSHALLFPRRLPEHFHGVENGHTVPFADPPLPTQHGAIPYWMLVLAGLGVFLGCVGKSAQFPLHVWLPDAMEGPTPVSALIHAATMVAAGVYLVGRCYPLFTSEVLLVIAYTGGITLFVAATIAVVVTDIKKVLAYSTVSQLGYMMLALGVGGWVAGLFHLITHAFFKALLFLCSGSVIYGCHHEQDMLKMGGLYPKMKITALCMLAGVLAIAGIPLFTGWYSKDAILAQALGFVHVHREHTLLFLLPLITAGITAFYMSRMWLMTFTGPPRDAHVYEHAHESPWQMTVPLIVLAVCSVAVAWGKPIWDAEASYLEHHVHHAQPYSVLADFGNLEETEVWGVARQQDVNERYWAKELHALAGTMALGLVAIAVVFAGLIYLYRVLDPAEAKEQFPRLHAFLMDKWRIDWLYSVILVRPALVVGHAFKAFDQYVIDGFINGLARLAVLVSRWDGLFDSRVVDGLVNVVGDTTFAVGARLRNVQTGYLRSYVLFLVIAAVGIFVLLSYLLTVAVAG